MFTIERINYSYLSASIGLAFAALNDCTLTIKMVSKSVTTPEKTKGKIGIAILKANSFNH